MTISFPLDAKHLGLFRPIEDRDAESLFTLIGNCFLEYEGITVERDGLDSDLKAYASYIASEGGEAFGLFEGDNCLASMAYALSDGVAEVKRFYMLKEARGGGLAPAMLARLETLAMARGASSLVLWSDTRFERAHRFYEREGYRNTGETRPLNDPSNSIEYRFVKDI